LTVTDIEIDDDEIRFFDEKAGVRAVIRARLPDGSMKWVVFVVLAIFLGSENLGYLSMP